ncbi:NEW3 domain-containing protein [Microbispora sp. NBRC 16548]|uniref:NEW3 domain-containing protein n=1 Tax=Microbispora sp. NBRC 16548 TaxID=3030994 RepID=UPI0024A1C87D|nr:NEW3 domain-containing protein [Microbispora sp. NBRC 16548]GLX10060.1 hypothetical protein Misp03_69860 [Microbispora sp. NBRC 16548]
MTAARRRAVPASDVTLTLPKGWTATPATVHLPASAPGRTRTATFTVTSGPADGTRSARITATATGDGWTGGASPPWR